MNILYLSVSRIDLSESGIYADLVNCLIARGHSVTLLTASQRRSEKEAPYYGGNLTHIPVRTPNVTGKCSRIEKGLGLLALEHCFLSAIHRHLNGAEFDLVLYATPPVTFAAVIAFCKEKYGARAYLMLKDIFPQNALDLGMLSKKGLKGLLYAMFRRKERRLYALSDVIGCMSEANRRYLFEHEPWLSPGKITLCPNAVAVSDLSLSPAEKKAVRHEYGLPEDKVIFVYGGNLGKPQGIPFAMECMKRAAVLRDAFFLIVGGGTEYERLRLFCAGASNARLMKTLPKRAFDKVVASCDAGLIFLDHRFTIPNFPSRLLSYMQAKLPVLVCSDEATDMGKTVEDGGFGWRCPSNDTSAFVRAVSLCLEADRVTMGENALRFMSEHYNVEAVCDGIERAML
ncbi:MAG: glycosyltransferase family 4 protein [Mailhella sp.]|nr:glycosyltransferase family 4 protein [Mailhella sp.]